MSTSQNVNASQFLTRLFELPIVSSAFEFSAQTYQRSKWYNGLSSRTFALVENAATLVIKNKSFVSVLENPTVIFALSVADNFAVKALDVVEDKFPVITHPTDQTKYLMNVLTDRVYVIVSLISTRLNLIRVVIVDRFGRCYEFVTRLAQSVVVLTNQRLEDLTEGIKFDNIASFMDFYIADVQSRRDIVFDELTSTCTWQYHAILDSLNKSYAMMTTRYDLMSRIANVLSLCPARQSQSEEVLVEEVE